MTLDLIEKNLKRVRENVRKACEASGRNPNEVNLLAVSKSQNIEVIENAYQAGQHNFGENYLQEAKEKIDRLPLADWHFIGAIQSNKTKEIANKFNWVHSVDSEKLAKRLSEQRNPKKGKLNIFIQVNTSREPQKRGVHPDEVYSLAKKISVFSNISFAGLMTIPAQSHDEYIASSCFRNLRQISEQISPSLGVGKSLHLSMGMSNDYLSAIKEGSTWVRIGTMIFGPRDKIYRDY